MQLKTLQLKPLRLTTSWQLTIPLAGAFLGFCVANLSDSIVLQATAALAALYATAQLFQKDIPKLLAPFVFALLGFWLAVWRVNTIQPMSTSVIHLPQQEISLEATVADYRAKESSTQLILRNIKYGKEEREGGVLLTINKPLVNWKVGDRVRVSCKAKIPEDPGYAQYLAAQNIHLTCFTSDDMMYLGSTISPSALAWQLRTNFEAVVDRRFSEPYATLMTGLLIGDVIFSEDYQNAFKVIGISHMVAASGSNVTMTVGLVLALLASIGIRRQESGFFVALAILFFVILSGMSSAVIRAGLMGFVVLIGRTVGRTASMRNVLLLVVVGILFVRPLWLLHDVGFQLSVASTWGLLYLSPFFKRVFAFIPEAIGLQEALSTTLAATLATAPVMMFGFGQFSLVAPVANLLILPAIPYIITTGAAALAAPPMLLFTAAPWLGLEWILRVSEMLGSLSAGLLSFESPYMRTGLATLFVCATLSIYLKEQRQRLA